MKRKKRNEIGRRGMKQEEEECNKERNQTGRTRRRGMKKEEDSNKR